MLHTGGEPELRRLAGITDPTARSGPGWTFDWLRSWAEIWDERHLRAWREVLARGDEVHASPFMHPDVVRAWVEAHGGETVCRPYFLHARHASGQQVLWLLVRRRNPLRTGLFRLMEPAGEDLFDYHDPVVLPRQRAGGVLAPGFWPALEAELRRHEGDWFDHCSFSRIRPECFGEGRFEEAAGRASLVRLDAYPDFAAYMDARRGSINKLARKQRKLATSGQSGLRVYRPDEVEAVLAWVPDLMAAHRARYPDSKLTAEFLESLVRHGVPAGVVFCSALELDGKPFSWHIGYSLNGVYYDYVCGFDAAHARLSPGLMHVHALIEWLYREGTTRVFDFLLGSEGYKADWTDGGEVTVRNAGVRSKARSTRLLGLARRGLFAIGNATSPVRGHQPATPTVPAE
jgi:CelD/BcsL family acetyltransferase involved in cellulose biosynthesis